jgi:hypothetical protein
MSRPLGFFDAKLNVTVFDVPVVSHNVQAAPSRVPLVELLNHLLDG